MAARISSRRLASVIQTCLLRNCHVSSSLIRPSQSSVAAVTMIHHSSAATGNITRPLCSSTNATSDMQEILDQEDPRNELNPEGERMFKLLLAYKGKHGDCHVPSGKGAFSIQERDRLGVSEELANWVSEQRASYRRAQRKRGKLSRPLQIKILLLEEMGFMWSEREAQWQRYFNLLEKYKLENNGDLNVDKEKFPVLSRWTEKQRKLFQKGELSQDRADLLEDLDFVFDVREAKWWEFYNKLLEYQGKHGDLFVPSEFEVDPSLGNWVARQRRNYHSKDLAEDRIKALDDIGFSWDVKNDTWDTYYAELVKFYEKYGHTRVPRTSRLWSWVDRQRRQLRRLGYVASPQSEHKVAELEKLAFDWIEDDDSELSPGDQISKDRAKKLMELPFKAAIHDELWIQNFRQLCAFQDKYGHFNVPYDGPSAELSNWARHQRYLHKRSKLSKERVVALDNIDFPWTAQDARWDRLYEELVRFHAETGHTRVPTRNSELYRWTNQQRKVLRDKEENPDSVKIPSSRTGRFLELESIIFEQ